MDSARRRGVTTRCRHGTDVVVRPSTAARHAGRPSRSASRINVEVDHVPTNDGARPGGRVWPVTLRGGPRLVVVATELGRRSADNRANQISDLLNDLSRTQGVAIDQVLLPRSADGAGGFRTPIPEISYTPG